MSCDNCGPHEHEFFRMVSLEFDVAAANKLVTPGRPTRVVPQNFLRGMGLPLEEEKCLNCGAPIAPSPGFAQSTVAMIPGRFTSSR